MEKVYIAIPYSSVDKEESFKLANKAAAFYYNKGFIVYSPISHSHPIAIQEDLPKGFDFWEKIDYEFIDWCDYVVVVKMQGWDKSTGVKKEIEYCKKTNKPFCYLELDELYDSKELMFRSVDFGLSYKKERYEMLKEYNAQNQTNYSYISECVYHMYKNRIKIEKISQTFGYTNQGIHAMLTKLQVKRRNHGGKRNVIEVPNNVIKDIVETNTTHDFMSKKHGISAPIISKIRKGTWHGLRG